MSIVTAFKSKWAQTLSVSCWRSSLAYKGAPSHLWTRCKEFFSNNAPFVTGQICGWFILSADGSPGKSKYKERLDRTSCLEPMWYMYSFLHCSTCLSDLIGWSCSVYQRLLGFSNYRELLSSWPQYWGASLSDDDSVMMLPLLVYFLFAFARFTLDGSSKKRKWGKSHCWIASMCRKMFNFNIHICSSLFLI